MEIRSPAFPHEGPIPRRYTCDGADVSPPLVFEDVPERARSLVLVVEDPDAPDPARPRMVWVHWLVYDLAPDCGGLPEGGPLPAGARQGTNDFGRTAWGGPCPPVGTHRYFFRLYALSEPLGDLGAPRKGALLAAMDGKVLAEAQLVGLYRRAP